MPRNNSRINQTSTALLQSWRANCDVQILIYESHPDNFDLREVSKVTDYVVAYSCKGTTTYREEVEINKRLILGMQGTTGDSEELKSLCKHLSNKAASSRLISKPEASVLLGNLDLVVCSDFIENISISDNSRLTISGNQGKNKSFLWQYMHRPVEDELLSLHQYYPKFRERSCGKQAYIPHYVGVQGVPTYPVSQGYARHVLVVYRPWREYPNMKDWKYEFESFVRSSVCPKSARLTYLRVLQRHQDGTKFVEPVASLPNMQDNEISKEDEEAMLLAGLGGLSNDVIAGLDLQQINRGRNFDWGKPAMVRLKQFSPIICESIVSHLTFSTWSKCARYRKENYVKIVMYRLRNGLRLLLKNMKLLRILFLPFHWTLRVSLFQSSHYTPIKDNLCMLSWQKYMNGWSVTIFLSFSQDVTHSLVHLAPESL